jgi:hypothetical protein
MKLFRLKKEKSTEMKPMGAKTTVQRPIQPVQKLSDEQLKSLKDNYKKDKQKDSSIDPYFIQEISDRLFGPDKEDYINALRELHKRIKPRVGRVGHDIFKDEK